jgi:TRAP-type C4-dicarboxylate transport system permease small subunit
MPPHPLTQTIRRMMDALYVGCAVLAGLSLVAIVIVIPWGVYTRYVLDSASSWPEPLSILLTVVMTFFGGAMCYRNGTHMRVTVLRDAVPPGMRFLVDLAAEGLVAVVGVFMVVWGARLVAATWHQTIAEFPAISTGITYLPIPAGGAVTLLFIIERLAIGPPLQQDWRPAAPD